MGPENGAGEGGASEVGHCIEGVCHLVYCGVENFGLPSQNLRTTVEW